MKMQVCALDGCEKKFVNPGRKFCCDEHRAMGQKRRQPKPENQVTFACATCGKVNTRSKKYGSTISGKRFCSNACAAKHTKTVRNYVVRETDMVLDSTWEMLFAGLCGFLKINYIRVDRQEAVTTPESQSYAPDFLVDGHIWVEIKGYDGNEQRVARKAWIQEKGSLLVLGKKDLDILRGAENRVNFLTYLEEWVEDSTEEDINNA